MTLLQDPGPVSRKLKFLLHLMLNWCTSGKQ